MDAPKNPRLLKEGIVQQLYNVAGSNFYMDPKTGEMFNKSEFSQDDLSWREKPEKWEAKHRIKLEPKHTLEGHTTGDE